MENSVISAKVVSGEAAESDSEEASPRNSNVNTSVLHGTVISGEASESDDDRTENIPISPKKSNTQLTSSLATRHYESLLHKKLAECNVSIYNNTSDLLKTTVNDALTQLSSIDQQLLKSQLRIQNATASLKTLDTTSYLLAEMLKNAAYGSYIPKVTIPIDETDSD